jgi:hypothetical protein
MVIGTVCSGRSGRPARVVGRRGMPGRRLRPPWPASSASSAACGARSLVRVMNSLNSLTWSSQRAACWSAARAAWCDIAAPLAAEDADQDQAQGGQLGGVGGVRSARMTDADRSPSSVEPTQVGRGSEVALKLLQVGGMALKLLQVGGIRRVRAGSLGAAGSHRPLRGSWQGDLAAWQNRAGSRWAARRPASAGRNARRSRTAPGVVRVVRVVRVVWGVCGVRGVWGRAGRAGCLGSASW